MSRARAEPVAISPLPIEAGYLRAHATPLFPSLDQWQVGKRVPPVLLLTGPRGCGKREIAYYLAQTLQCEKAGFASASAPEDSGFDLFGGGAKESEAPSSTEISARACGVCANCARAIDGNSFNFREIRIETDAKTYGVHQFREMKETAGFSGYGGGYRIFLIAEAERMTNQAANSLLKILEEPPEGWIFLLTVADPSLLPSTVVSRCQMLRLRPLPEVELANLLTSREIPADRVAVLASLAEGSLTRALELSEDESWETRSTILQFLCEPQTAFADLVDYASSDPARFRLLLDQFEQLLADLIRKARMPDIPYRNEDAQKSLETHFVRCAKRLGTPAAALNFWISRSERLFRMRREMTAPLNQKILVQDFLAPWMDAV